ncbi:MAG TPA: glycosyltransferase, partial [Puia sp.]|nr:glycosyltransferase [Puia sp.]
ALIVSYRRVWKTIPLFVPRHQSAGTKITVLIPARNEQAVISECLQSLARQSYPKDRFEVLVLDDHSTDATTAAVRDFAVGGEANGLVLRCLPMAEVPQPTDVKAYKKWAIEKGIDTAAGDLIVTTDADCFFHPDWLSTMAACHEEKGAVFIAAPVRIGTRHHSLLGIFQTLDFITLQGITGAAVSSGFHSMCNGANLAYTRSSFYAAGGFAGIDHLPSGDDMLLMHKIRLHYPDRVSFLKSRQAIVTTRPANGWKEFLHQRVRWASKADSYQDKRVFWILLLVYIVNASFIALFVAAFFNTWWLWVLLLLLVTKTIVEYPFVREVAGFFGQQQLMIYFPVLQPLHILYTVIVGWLGKFGSYDWKGRTTNK